MHIDISTMRSLVLTWFDESFVQSFNSLGQDPCTIAAYMLSTCNGGCESLLCLFCLALATHIDSSLQRSPSGRCSRDTVTLAQTRLTTPTCASAVPSDIRS